MFKSVTIGLLLICFSIQVKSQFAWPEGKKAAVVFTYDDALDCHLDVAVPQLDEFNFKGTFYCTGKSQSLNKRTNHWRQIAAKGHELGNHTLFHPCDANKHTGVKPEYDLNNYTVQQFITELETANILLKAIDGKTARTYGYTCSDYVVGGEDISLKIDSLFDGGRCSGDVPKSMKDFRVYKAPCKAMIDASAKEMINYVKEAQKHGTIAVFVFHSVGGGYLNVGAHEHRALLQYVKEHESELYTGTFLEVMNYIKINQ